MDLVPELLKQTFCCENSHFVFPSHHVELFVFVCSFFQTELEKNQQPQLELEVCSSIESR